MNRSLVGKIVDVWRVENSTGDGPYNGWGQYNWSNVDHNGHLRPNPYDEGIPLSALKSEYGAKDVLCGFSCVTKAKRWFTKVERRRLERGGFILKKVRAKVLAEGKRQLVFIKVGDT